MLTRKQALDQAIGRSGLTQKEISDKTKISEATLCRKLQNPEEFTIKEIELLDSVLGFTDDEAKAIMRGKYDKWF